MLKRGQEFFWKISLFFLELIGAFGMSWGLVLYGQVIILKTLIKKKKQPVFQKKKSKIPLLRINS